MNYRDEHSQRDSKVLTLHRNLQAFRSFAYDLNQAHRHVNANKHTQFMENQMDNLYVNRFDLFCNGRAHKLNGVDGELKCTKLPQCHSIEIEIEKP